MGRQSIFITGGTGYIGSRLIPLLAQRNHSVRALVRNGSEGKLPSDFRTIEGNALDESTFVDKIQPPTRSSSLSASRIPAHPRVKVPRDRSCLGPRLRGSCRTSGRPSFLYLSVAHPAPTMKDYIVVRCEGESLLKTSGLNATILRPWYVLGPGHRWPYLLVPFTGCSNDYLERVQQLNVLASSPSVKC